MADDATMSVTTHRYGRKRDSGAAEQTINNNNRADRVFSKQESKHTRVKESETLRSGRRHQQLMEVEHLNDQRQCPRPK